MDSFSTKSLALQAQKKLMSKMATKSMANLFIDDTSSEVLDELYRVTKEYTRNRKESQKIIKNLIKMVVKLGVLYRNNQFNSDELILVENFRYTSEKKIAQGFGETRLLGFLFASLMRRSMSLSCVLVQNLGGDSLSLEQRLNESSCVDSIQS